ncbi:MAG TPA: hypothetical protein ENI15_11050 [Spirochaetes bacterium]|nr:hypothetical protein [Spirochaetota bacterium]
MIRALGFGMLALFLSLGLCTGVRVRCAADEYTPLKVIVSESHHRALYHWLAEAENGTLPESGVTVIHFDAHPDMSLPSYPIRSEWPEDIDKILERVTISSFQLAAVHIGLVSRIIWLKPDWSGFFPEGSYTFVLGEDSSGTLKVDHTSDYYVLMGSWSPANELRNTSRVEFQVRNLRNAVSDVTYLRSQKPQILDIDLDGYSTNNPDSQLLLRHGFSEGEIDRIREIFLPHQHTHSDNPLKRIEDVNAIRDIIKAIENGQEPRDIERTYNLSGLGLDAIDISDLVQIIGRDITKTRIDALCDHIIRSVGLPEHFASEKEIEKTTNDLISLIKSDRIDPDLITIARSVDDGFTPPELLSRIENSLLKALRTEFENLSIQYDSGVEPLSFEK